MIKTPQHVYENLTKDLEIDRNNLHDELMKQPQLFRIVSEGFAEAVSMRDTAEFVLHNLDADLALNIRKSAMEKLTEAKVKEMVTIDPNHVQQMNMVLEYQLQADRWSGLRTAFMQRSSMLGNLIDLYKLGYFSTGIGLQGGVTSKLDAYIADTEKRVGGTKLESSS